ncbi:Aminopeptidase 2 [Candidatus Promineifilum breve]|uniref:Aminopeptidase 2 n=1 Tax=Candidatus Promineifilum breve TaxID=1806508 RepID=A0A160T8Q4_9CHLR|nr:aminopeptidase [Candidatus Promineifilum breve]CUS06129.1 Aminopeptidase 2 [Candidatus Promineifilum breve]
MTPEFDRQLAAYAELIVKVGLNLQAGQRLMVRAPLEAAPLVRHVAAHAYQGGARLVEVLWNDPLLVLERYRHAPRDSFAEVSQWPVNAGLEYAEAGQAFLSIIGVDPELLKDVAPELVATTRRAEGMAAMPLARLMSADAVNWCVVGYATAGWAARVFPDLPPAEQQQRLWQAIFRTVRLDAADPVATWEAHSDQLLARTAFLNEKQYTALHFTGPGTDLVVGLPAHHHWIGGGAPTALGFSNIANLPTEEVFTAPHRDRVEGTVRATMPLNYSGNLIENFSLTFKDGKVVDFSAERGEELLRSHLATDEGAARLGEVALVPHSSPIAQSGLLFLNTLYDENASSHVALGRAYQNCIAGCEGLDEAAFAEMGGNSSVTHLDFMIGSAEIDVDGLLGDVAEPLMRGGEWVN